MSSDEERVQRDKRDLGLKPGTGQHLVPGRSVEEVHIEEYKSRASWKPRKARATNRISGHEGLMPLRDRER